MEEALDLSSDRILNDEMCTALLPLGVNPIAVNRYMNVNINTPAREQRAGWGGGCGLQPSPQIKITRWHRSA